MTILEFEEISILSLEPRSQEIKEFVRLHYGLEGLRLLNGMYLQDDLEKELEELEKLLKMDKEERLIHRKTTLKQEIKLLKERLKKLQTEK